jgi:hypothetical protein
VIVTDSDECALSEGLGLALQGRGFVPYPGTPPPRPRPDARREMEESQSTAPDGGPEDQPEDEAPQEVTCSGGVTLPPPAGQAARG